MSVDLQKVESGRIFKDCITFQFCWEKKKEILAGTGAVKPPKPPETGPLIYMQENDGSAMVFLYFSQFSSFSGNQGVFKA